MDALSYSVVLEREPDGGFSATVPAFPEAVTQGDTIDEALKNARDVIALCIVSRRDLGDEIPPSDLDVVLARVSLPKTA